MNPFSDRIRTSIRRNEGLLAGDACSGESWEVQEK